MKVSLVVASGAHQGKVIQITGPQFLIGRDPQCQLRPASQAISKRHCGVLIRDGKVYIKDFGSTNGTTVNDELIKNAEIQVESGASVKLGPLDFRIDIEKTAIHPDGTPLPAANPEAAAALAAVTAAAKTASRPVPQRDITPNPAKPVPGSKEQPALKSESSETPNPAAALTSSTPTEHDEHMAAMLLGMDEDGKGEVPDGSTVMDIPTPEELKKSDDSKGDDAKKKVVSREDMTNAASEILRKMMRRPK
ncbi:MAG TPA: FHA domain-containing protein [Gemmata sp.]|nr:FHA domain-containing protein [Gemmata sp.]